MLTIALIAAPTKPRTDAEPNKVEGNALRVNDNSVEGGKSPPLRRSLLARSEHDGRACKLVRRQR
ncbi:hypothetical protein [Mesorhizobium caraganae]|uniref:hypothetical protein n=1 Tax=Mesorhizobium caraganae TaxID=483206 RepID=UPI003ED15E5F